MIISFEGLDLCGKSTQVEIFQKITGGYRIPQYATKQDPAATPLERAQGYWFLEQSRLGLAEAIVNYDAIESTKKVMKDTGNFTPTGSDHDTIILDRSIDTTYAYSALFVRKGTPEQQEEYRLWMEREHEFSTFPDITFFLKTTYAETRKRATGRGFLDSEFDLMPEPLWNLVNERYMALAERCDYRFRVIDATKTIDEVAAEIRATYVTFLQELFYNNSLALRMQK